MPHEIVVTDADIRTKPDTLAVAKEKTTVTFGDLHGNALKLLHLLTQYGFITISDADYASFVSLYHKDSDDLTAADLAGLDALLERISLPHPHLILRLIGDELGDRGQNDYFSLKILARLQILGQKTEVLFSNHSNEFIYAYEKHKRDSADFVAHPFIHDGHVTSLSNLNKLCAKGLVPPEKVIELINKSYKPSLKLVSYDFTEDGLTLYSHAPIDVSILQNLAQSFAINFEAETPAKLAFTIDKINFAWQQVVKSNEVHTQLNEIILEAAYNHPERLSKKECPFTLISWFRNISQLKRTNEAGPKHHGLSFDLTFVHGHDPEIPSEANVINLDNHHGKLLVEDEDYPGGGPIGKSPILCTASLEAKQLFPIEAEKLELAIRDIDKQLQQSLRDCCNQVIHEAILEESINEDTDSILPYLKLIDKETNHLLKKHKHQAFTILSELMTYLKDGSLTEAEQNALAFPVLSRFERQTTRFDQYTSQILEHSLYTLQSLQIKSNHDAMHRQVIKIGNRQKRSVLLEAMEPLAEALFDLTIQFRTNLERCDSRTRLIATADSLTEKQATFDDAQARFIEEYEPLLAQWQTLEVQYRLLADDEKEEALTAIAPLKNKFFSFSPSSILQEFKDKTAKVHAELIAAASAHTASTRAARPPALSFFSSASSSRSLGLSIGSPGSGGLSIRSPQSFRTPGSRLRSPTGTPKYLAAGAGAGLAAASGESVPHGKGGETAADTPPKKSASFSAPDVLSLWSTMMCPRPRSATAPGHQRAQKEVAAETPKSP